MSLAELRTDLVILTCAISAGIHGALVRAHFAEGTGAGAGFVAATFLLAILAVVLTRNPTQFALAGTAAVFVALIVSYGLVITTGVPVLHPDVETVDGLALFTKGVDAVGFAAAASLLRRPSLAVVLSARPIPIALTALVACFSALAALAVSNGMNMAHAHGNVPQHAQAPMMMRFR